jgi:O-antigen/teichoic acid export membrane protein
LPTFLAQQSTDTIRFAQSYLAIVVIYPLYMIVIATFRRAQYLTLWNTLRIAPTAGWFCLLIVAFLVGTRHAGSLAIYYLWVLTLLFLPAIYLVVRFIQGPFRPSSSVARQMLGFSLPTVFSVIPQLMNTRLDQLVIAGFLPAKSLGLYVVAVAWSSIPNPLLYGLGTVLFPHVAQLTSADAQKAAFASGSRLGLTLCLLTSVAVAVVTPWCVPMLFGSEFASGVPIALILVAAGSVSGFNTIVEEGLRGLGQPRAVMYAEIGGMCAMGVTLFLLLPRLGLIGAGLACLVAYLVVACLLLVQARRLAGKKISELLMPRRAEIFGAVSKILAQVRRWKTNLSSV